MTTATAYDPNPVSTITMDDLSAAVRDGWADFIARPTTAIFLIVIYPFLGLLLYRFAFDQALLPLLFPIASGFALIGPITAIGTYEISRRRAQKAQSDDDLDGVTAFQALDGNVTAPVFQIGLLLLVIYAAWIGTAQLIYAMTFGDYVPAGIGDLLAQVFTTGAGWTLLIVGCATGFLFALAVLAIAAISIPAVYDRGLGAAEAVGLSVKAFATNTKPMMAWGFIVTAAIIAGSIPAFLGLMVVLPVFGHATWHLYKRLVP